MKQVVNSYAAKSVIGVDYGRELLTQVRELVGQISSFGWLMMIILAVSALSFSTFVRSRAELREAQAALESSARRVESARGLNQDIRRQTEELRTNPRAGKLAAKERLRMVGRHEVVVAVK